MSSFLTRVYEEIKQEDYPNTVIIFPTQRAISLFKNEIHRNAGKPIELPAINTWSGFIEQQIPHKEIDKDVAIALLHKVYCTSFKSSESFTAFLNWGASIYNDFERIVLQNLPGEKVLNQVNMLKALDKWELDLAKKEKYLQVWEKLPLLFKNFYEYLQKRKLCTSSLKYVIGLDELRKTSFLKKKIYFCGFTVFSPVEKEIITFFKESRFCCLIEDSPLWNGIDQQHESNRFSIENSTLFSKVITVGSEKELARSIESIECGNDAVASKLVSKELSKMTEAAVDQTAIILLNDNDLPLLMNSIPGEVNSINVGKGKSYGNTPEGALFKSILKINKELKRKNEIKFPVVFDFLDQLKPFDLLKPEVIDQIRENILKKNIRSLSRRQFSDVFSKTELNSFSELFKTGLDTNVFVSKLLEIKNFSWSGTCVRLFFTARNNYELLSKEQNDGEVFSYLLEKELNSTYVAVQGEMKSGLQVLSLLETRCLDFKNLIFLSFLDENLPQSKQSSLIPLELRIQYRFPDQMARESILANHFMRLLKRAESSKFIYSSGSTFSKSGDPSRFVLQAAMEWSKNDKGLKFTSSIVKNDLEPFVNKELIIEKSDRVHEAIKHYLFERGMSPSALNVYLSNPMDFLIYHVLGLREKENVDLSIETSSLGTVIHDTLEILYKPYRGKLSNTIEYETLGTKILNQLVFELSKIYPKNYLENGRLKILLPILEKWVKNFLAIDKKRGEAEPFKLVSVEEKLEYQLAKISIPLKMKGIVDRIERWKGAEHVIDYKTGKVDQKDLRLDSQELLEFNPNKSKAYQLLMYAYIYRGVKQSENPFLSSIYSFRNQRAGFIPLLIDDNELIDEHQIKLFEKGMEAIALNMLDRKTPIELTNHRYKKFSI
ncbi:MAG: hypothetical protein CL840_22070 [Crocinitomicaceae bacterium]|nr:hypothetical protein [Crocinitomicaceae bacterium]|tara:strand:- start:19735 stop:22398 length:2664 start_codon:yes stop_codon:yes gene_type:complete